MAAYYCTTAELAQDLVGGQASFPETLDQLEWLGLARYFFEEPAVAWLRTRERLRRSGVVPTLALVEVDLDLTNCLDFLDPRVGQAVRSAHEAYVAFEKQELADRLPQAQLKVENGEIEFADPPENPNASPNTVSRYANRRDSLFLRWYLKSYKPVDGAKTSIRAAFLFGHALYPESLIFDGVHVQIAVLDPTIIQNPRLYRLGSP